MTSELTGQHNLQQISDTIELDWCTKCGGYEGSLTTDCPGISMTSEHSDRVYDGGLDFRTGEGWVRKLSPMGHSIVVRSLFDIYRGREYAPKNINEVALRLGVSREEILPIIKDHEDWVLKEEGYR